MCNHNFEKLNKTIIKLDKNNFGEKIDIKIPRDLNFNVW